MPVEATTSEGPMWIEVATEHPDYVRELFESLTCVQQPAGVDGQWSLVGPGGSTVGRICTSTHPGGRVLPIFAVTSVVASLEAATRLGGSVSMRADVAGHEAFEIHDPNGHRFAVTEHAQVSEPTAGARPPEGLFAEVIVDDLAQVDGFYAPVLGGTVDVVKVPSPPTGMSQPESGYRVLRRGKSVIAGAIESSFFLLGETGLSWLVYLEVPDLAAAVVTAVELGCRVLVPPGLSPQGQYSVIQDPDGIAWGLGVTVDFPQGTH